MQNKNVKISLLLAAIIIPLMVIALNCSKPGFEGDSPVNLAPKCYLANIPPDGEKFSRNPILYWYATDIDGFISEYRFIVKKAEDINDDPLGYIEGVMASGNYSDWTDIVVEDITPGNSATYDTIRSFASYDPEVYTKQYMFIQAIDNHGALSNFTDSTLPEVKVLAYRGYSRNNHPPETHLTPLPEDKVYFSLVDTTELYKGVTISWSGSDSLDYTRAQPPFEYRWQVFGPFATIDDTSTTDMSKLIYGSSDTLGNVWVENEFAVLFNLYRNQGPADTTRANYFTFLVEARDDAYVPDPTPATVAFYAVEPAFENAILLVDNNTYIGSHCVLRGKGNEFGRITPTDQEVTRFQEYYKYVFQQAGYYNESKGDAMFWYYQEDPYIPNKKYPPPLDILLRYKLVVNINENHKPIYTDADYFEDYADYLNLGGKMMFIGWNNFAQFESEGLHPYTSQDFPYKYFGVTAEYYTYWKEEDFDKIGPSKQNTPEEYIQGERVTKDLNLPQYLYVDSEGHLRDYYITSTTWDSNTRRNSYPFKGGAEPWVNYFVKSISSEALYTSKSVYPDFRDFEKKFKQSSIDGKVNSVRMRTSLFRTAAFGFSMYSMPEDQAIELIRVMMDWFFEED
jgi:hypothetical protein